MATKSTSPATFPDGGPESIPDFDGAQLACVFDPPLDQCNQAVFGSREPPLLKQSADGWFDKPALEQIGSAGEKWLALHSDLVRSFPGGTVLAINVMTGEFEHGARHVVVMDKFEKRFGSATVAFVHEVAVPATVGGGWWALKSGA